MQLFVYGTLKDPSCLNAVLGPAAWRTLGPATVAGILYDCGEYPALVGARTEEDVVPGLLLELDDERALARLDAYEGVESGLYVRRRCEVRLDSGQLTNAWGYLYNRPTVGLRRIAAWPPERD